MGQHPRTSAIERCPYAFLSSTVTLHESSRSAVFRFALQCICTAEPHVVDC